MDLLDKSDLNFDYSWSTKGGDNPITERKRGKYFNKDAGEDVLELINEYAEEKNITDRKVGLDIESQIHKNLSKISIPSVMSDNGWILFLVKTEVINYPL